MIIPTASVIGYGIQGAAALGQLGIALTNNREEYKYEELPMLSPEQISAQEQLNQNDRMAAGANRNIRNMNIGQGSFLTNNAAVNLGAGQQGAQIQERVDNVNAQLRQQTAGQNAGIRAQNIANKLNVQNLNVAERDAYMQNIMSSIGTIGNVGAGVAKDVNAYNSQADAMKYYERADAGFHKIGTNTYQKYRRIDGSEFYIDNGKQIDIN